MKALLWIVVAVVVIGGAAYLGVMHHNNAASALPGLTASTSNPFGSVSTTATTSTSTMMAGQAPSATPAPVASAPSSASPTCNSILPASLVQSAFPGDTVQSQQLDNTGGAILVNCEYPVMANGNPVRIIAEVYDASQEGSYSSTVQQLGSEGYKCTDISSTVGFTASLCAMGTGIGEVAFTTSNGKYSVLITSGGAAGFQTGPLEKVAGGVNSNLSS